MGVGDHQLHAGQATGRKVSDELSPGGLRFDLAHVDADHLSATRLVDAVGDKQRLVAHRVGL